MGSLSTYASAIEMAFSANLLVSAWASVYTLLEKREDRLKEKVKAFRKNPNLRERIGQEQFEDAIGTFRNNRQRNWLCGLVSSIFAALFLYVLIWFAPMINTVPWWLGVLLILAAFLGPTLMAWMYYAGKRDYKAATTWERKIDLQVAKAYHEARVRVTRLGRKGKTT